MRRLFASIAFFTILFLTAGNALAAGEVQVAIPVSMNPGVIPSPFTVTLSQDGEIKDHMELSGMSTGKFDLSFAVPGTYFYKVAQEIGTDPEILYDKTVYDVAVSIFTDGEGNLSAEASVFIEGQDVKQPACAFVNMYMSESGDKEPETRAPVDPSVVSDHRPGRDPGRNSGQPDKSTDAIQTGDEPLALAAAGVAAFAAMLLLCIGVAIWRRRWNRQG